MYHKFKPESERKNVTVLFFHENAGNLGLRLDYFQAIYHDLGYDIIAFAYRGYSESIFGDSLKQNFPSEKSIKEDAELIK